MRDFQLGVLELGWALGTSTTTKAHLWGSIFPSVIFRLRCVCEDKMGHDRADST